VVKLWRFLEWAPFLQPTGDVSSHPFASRRDGEGARRRSRAQQKKKNFALDGADAVLTMRLTNRRRANKISGLSETWHSKSSTDSHKESKQNGE
jgi:hypothetical protein